MQLPLLVAFAYSSAFVLSAGSIGDRVAAVSERLAEVQVTRMETAVAPLQPSAEDVSRRTPSPSRP